MNTEYNGFITKQTTTGVVIPTNEIKLNDIAWQTAVNCIICNEPITFNNDSAIQTANICQKCKNAILKTRKFLETDLKWE